MMFEKNDGLLDSFGLVSLIAIIEDKIDSQYGIKIILADDKAFSMKLSPFYNIERLSSYVTKLVKVNFNE